MLEAKNKKWSLTSWKSYPCLQQPTYCDYNKVLEQKEKIKSLPPLVDFQEIEDLRTNLIECENGNQFYLQMGDCAERFEDCSSEMIESKLLFMSKCSEMLESYLKKPVLKIGRIAGQYAKPRSSDYESINGEMLFSYRGDMINEMDKSKRNPNPKKMTEGYFHSAATIMHENSENKKKSPIIDDIAWNTVLNKIYVSHEGLILDYEECLTRKAANNRVYDLSGHLIWIGERTRNPEQAHVNFFKGISNPIGVKIGKIENDKDFLDVFKKLNPENEKGKIVIIIRFGSKNVEKYLPKLINIKKEYQLNFLWVCDPMHGNTVSENGIKTRNYGTVLNEIKISSQILKENDEILGGLHLESTPHNVTECVGGKTITVESQDLGICYTTYCDPRLNNEQCFDLIREIKDFITF